MATTQQARLGWASAYWLALVLAAPALWLVVLPALTGATANRHAGHFPITYVHAVAGLTMLLSGSTNLYIGWTRRGFALHRKVGYLYLASGAIATSCVLWLFSQDNHLSTNTRAATGLLALFWIGTAAMGWRAVRNRRFDTHRDWMIRSYVLTWSFVGCRLFGEVPAISGLGAAVADALLWATWVVPLFICEVALQWPKGRRLEGS